MSAPLKRDVTLMVGQRSTVNFISSPAAEKSGRKQPVEAEAGNKVLVAVVFEPVEGRSLGNSCALLCWILLCPFVCLKLCIDWIMLEHWACGE